MVMRDDHMIDPLDPGGLGGGEDPLGVAVATVPGIDENRLARGCDQQGGGASLDIDEVHVQLAVVLARPGGGEESTRQHRTHQCTIQKLSQPVDRHAKLSVERNGDRSIPRCFTAPLRIQSNIVRKTVHKSKTPGGRFLGSGR
jgi:hypothetical protein